jgi:glutamine amidotransferase
MDRLLSSPAHSLVDQSLHSRLGAETTNGDGFGLGWYGREATPALFRSVEPAWNDANLREISTHLESRLFFAHIRASSGSPVQQTNCHPFRFDRWLWMHNGLVREFPTLKRDLVLSIDEALFPHLQGSTDSEVLFHLALTLGLRDDPPAAVERLVGMVEAVAQAHSVAQPLQLSAATTDGARVWAFRYSSEHRTRTLFYSADLPTLRALYPARHDLDDIGDESRVVVSEPLGDVPGVWQEVPESSWVCVGPGAHELVPFAPRPPT